uniref:ZP-C domain-containing protein n=1 Tax=Salarias fasciatus TaxID=181472 RepID=A0A672G0X3_SALFA
DGESAAPTAPRGAGPRFNPGLTDLPKPRAPSGPVLLLKLSTSESSEETRVGPCVITADQRVHVQVRVSRLPPPSWSLTASLTSSCVVSPLSDPKKSPYWTVIRDGCSSDPSLTLSEEEEEEEEEEPRQTSPSARGGAGAEQIPPLRFSFILRPVYQEPMQFLHCSLRLCQEPLQAHGGHSVHQLAGAQNTHPSRPEDKEAECESSGQSAARAQRSVLALSLDEELGFEPSSHSFSVLLAVFAVSVVQTGPLMGIVFAAFVLGVSLMGGLWCIYNCTGVCVCVCVFSYFYPCRGQMSPQG